MRLFIFQIHRIDIRNRAVAVPFEESDAGIFGHQVVHHAEYMILYFRIAKVEHHLVAEVVFITVRQMNHPVLMLFVKLAFGIYHFRLYPYTELDTFLLCFFNKTPYSVRKFVGSLFPVAQPLMVTATGIFVGKPTIVQQEHIYAQLGSLIHQADQFIFIKVKIGRFPVVEQSHAGIITVFHLMIARPVMEVTAGLTFPLRAVSEIEVRSTEHFSGGQAVFGVVRVDTADNTQFVFVVHFESKAKVTRPSDGSYQHFACILLRRIVKSQLEERRYKHIGTCTQLRIDHLFTESQFSFGHVGFVCPVTGKFSQEILAAVQVKH